jgi:hypothetical protein
LLPGIGGYNAASSLRGPNPFRVNKVMLILRPRYRWISAVPSVSKVIHIPGGQHRQKSAKKMLCFSFVYT